MKRAIGNRVGPLAVLLAALAAAAPTGAADEGTVKAFSVWYGQGQMYQTGVDEAMFTGALSGPLYVETERGPISAGMMLCLATVNIGLQDGKQRGSGHCTVTAEDDAKAFAEISCTGVHLVGCDGNLKLTGGTGRFEGISGGGPVLIRSNFREITMSSDATVGERALGITYLRELQYKIP